jgi:hypothetical protein
MKKDAMGLWASWGAWKVHQKINYKVFGNRWKTRVFNDATVAVDRHQKSYDSFLHAMRDARTHESISHARARSNHHVRTGFGVARTYINRGDGRRAYNTLGWVLHTLQDSTSPAHKYFKPWDGSSIWSAKGMRHVMQEAFMSQVRSNAYRATRYVWHMFYYRLVPNTNVFIF